MKNIFEIIELIIGEDNINEGFQAISLVDEGAIERDFMFFNKEKIKHEVKLEIHDEEKRIIMGPILVPNKMILRAYEDKGETQYFYVHFSEKTCRTAAHRFMENGFQGETTYQHEKSIDGVNFVEMWVKDFDDQDKSSGYGYADMPVGTIFGMARVDNDEVWEDIKAGKINAFSIEGRFADALLAQSAQSKLSTVDEVIEEIVDSPEDLEMLNTLIDLLNSIDESELEE